MCANNGKTRPSHDSICPVTIKVLNKRCRVLESLKTLLKGRHAIFLSSKTTTAQYMSFNWKGVEGTHAVAICICRYAEQLSRPIFLDKCRLYRMEAFMREESSQDHISLGMSIPSGRYEGPIPRRRLFWTKPGNMILS